MKSIILVLFITTCISPIRAAPLNLDRPWSRISTPLNMSTSFIRSFRQLPLMGTFKDKRKLWSGDYWALNKGSINYRWNAPIPSGFSLVSPSREQVLKMSETELATLAPSEKFDLLNGNYYYPLKKEVAKTANPRAQDWEGICHGWAPASMNHREPIPKSIMNKDGVNIPFGSSDIKALVSYYYAKRHKVNSTHQMGSRCSGARTYRDNCKHDMNAGAFHIVLANKIGLEGSSFIADVEEGFEVYNHPLHSYTSTITGNNLRPFHNSAPGTVMMIKVKTELKYIIEDEVNSWTPVIGTELQLYETIEYEYFLDIDSAGKIVGGEWISSDRPDFLWLMLPPAVFKGDFALLNKLMKDGP